jgi:flavin-dependent dehydrogenase
MSAGLDTDLAVVGAGPAGATTALFAAQKGHRVVILDRQEFPRDKPCGEGLMPSGRPPLRELGLEALVVGRGAPPLHGIQFGLVGAPATAVPFPRHAGEAHGLGVRRVDFDALLVEQLQRDPRIQFCPATAALRLQTGAGGRPTVVTAAGEIRARMIAVADGLRSSLRHQLGWTVGPKPPHRFGIVGHWLTNGAVDPWVRVTFDRGMEIYEGPVAGNQRMVGLLCSQDRMREFAGRLEARYRQLIQTLRPTLQGADPVGGVSVTGPFWYQAATVARNGVFLVGDAAGFSDPITAEGMATGLRQARALAAALDADTPEASYRRAHRRLTRDPRRVAALILRLTRTPELVRRGLRGHQRAPLALPKLLGVNFGYWGFNRITPREWIAIFTGR